MGTLSPYRIIDLTNTRGWFAGKLLADMGADVIKIEPPGGDPGRAFGPFAGRSTDPNENLHWWAYNRGKRSVVLDIEGSEADRDRLRGLITNSHAVLESFDPGVLDRLGLGVDALLELNPALVVTSVTPFGHDSPYREWQASDLIVFAMCGLLYLCGDPDRAPTRITVPQMFRHGAAEAAAHTAIGLYHAARTGQGQHVDVSAQLAGIRTLMNAQAMPFLHGYEQERSGAYINRVGGARTRLVFPCADGHVTLMSVGGRMGAQVLPVMMDWARREGVLHPELDGFDFADVEVAGGAGGLPVEPMNATMEGLFARHTKSELYEAALEHRLLIAPVNTTADLVADAQLAARGFWVSVDHDDRDAVTHPGPWYKSAQTPLAETGRAPRIGEHQSAVLGSLEGLTRTSGAARGAGGAGGATTGGVFEGLKVWDMSWVGVGPMTAGYLAAQGATVVKLDWSARPDILQVTPPFLEGQPGINRSHFYGDMNPNKLGLGLDIGTEKGRAIALQLAQWADVVLESFTPGTLADLGLAPDVLRELNPRLVVLSTCMQGQTGPRRSYRGFGNLMGSLSGFYAITGWPDRDPTFVYGAYTDFINQRLACLAVVGALDHVRRTGCGTHIDLAQYEGALHLLAPELLELTVNDHVVLRDGNRDRHMAPHGVYPTSRAGAWVAIACESDEQWRALVEVVGEPWASHERYASAAGRLASADELDERIAAWTVGRSCDEIVAALQPRVAAGPVHDQSGLHGDPQVVARGYFVPLEHTVMGSVPYQGSAARLSVTPPRYVSAAPCIGEHSWQVLTEIVGLSDDEVAELLAEGVIEITAG